MAASAPIEPRSQRLAMPCTTVLRALAWTARVAAVAITTTGSVILFGPDIDT